MSGMLCSKCGEKSAFFFIVIGDKKICMQCKKNAKPSKVIKEKEQEQVFIRYECLTHNVKTYNVQNMFFRHAMDDCEIVEKKTLGIIRPATQGGHNGDIGRQWFMPVNQMPILETALDNYIRFKKIKIRVSYKGFSRMDRKYFYSHQSFDKHYLNWNSVNVMNKNLDSLDDMVVDAVKKLESRGKKFYKSRASIALKKQTYYSELMADNMKRLNA